MTTTNNLAYSNGYGMPSGRRNFVHAMLGNDTFLILGGYNGDKLYNTP